MKIKPTTLILVVAALLLGGITALVVQTQEPATEQSEQPSDPQQLFSFNEEDVQTLTVETREQTLRFERQGENSWQMQEPQEKPASDASIAFLLDLVASGQSDRSITVPAGDRADFGLDEPLATVEVTLNDQETHTLVLGSYDFNRSFLYATADPPEDENADLNVLLVSPNFENAVTRPYEEWLQSEPAEAVSPSPEASPSASPDPTPTN
ncbi:MAG: hypothetical protein Kow00121_07840 [Elainellaceae cyanobacterium]